MNSSRQHNKQTQISDQKQRSLSKHKNQHRHLAPYKQHATSQTKKMPVTHIHNMDEWKNLMETSKSKVVVVDFTAVW
jgi:thiol:disulfide interchange protein